MYGDFSRNTFNPLHHFSRVLMQQGRVQLDADWNEQTAILLHYLQTLTRDIFGDHGGPPEPQAGFRIDPDEDNFSIGPGHYYVDGILCENDSVCWYQADGDGQRTRQPHFDPDKNEKFEKPRSNSKTLVYLDVWEQFESYAANSTLLEPALGGIDTAARARVVWQVKFLKLSVLGLAADSEDDELCTTLRSHYEQHASLRARLDSGNLSNDPCIQSPESRYRGPENQLYRIEIHDPGTNQDAVPTFKWSRENGSEVYPLSAMSGLVATLAAGSRIEELKEGDWLEYLDGPAHRAAAGPLLQVATIDPAERTVTFSSASGVVLSTSSSNHQFLRRWHQKWDFQDGKKVPLLGGAMRIVEGSGGTAWIPLEDGLQIQFQLDGSYRAGDHWLVPARVATGEIEWPIDGDGQPLAVVQHGVEHHYAPLAVLGSGKDPVDRRCLRPVDRECAKTESS